MKLKRIMLTTIALFVLVFLIGIVVVKQPKFGKVPTGERLERIKKSPHYKNRGFENLSQTPQMTNDKGFFAMTREYFSAKNKKPKQRIPSLKTNLFDLSKDQDVLVWFGHSSYFMQIQGKKILVDPVFSGNASPFSFSVKAFEGTDRYTADDIPPIDYLIITHDHWDHLDYKTLLELEPKVKKVVSALGIGSHLEYWGFKKDKLIELDWFEKKIFSDDFIFHAMPARHFSGRGFIHKKTLWVSFVLQSQRGNIFIGGDGGYDKHFREIGEKFGEFDLVILENGQYNKSWKYIHMMPEQVLQAAKDLNAKRLFPVHSMKFALANHAWDTPLKTIVDLNKKDTIPLLTPKIGEVVYLNEPTQKFSNWWEAMN